MLLRWLVLILLLVNALFFGWTQGWLDDIVGLKARGDREPERMARQVHPEMITLLKPQDLQALQAKTCVEFGPVDSEAALLAAQAALLHAGIAASVGHVVERTRRSTFERPETAGEDSCAGRGDLGGDARFFREIHPV